MVKKRVVVIGGGAAGFFGAIAAAENNPGAEVAIIEKSPKVLTKVRISGGGRCNVTHHCFDPKKLVENYPRGSRELLGPFHQFQPKDMVIWLKERGVVTKAEEDGRMFPVTDDSRTIIDCLLKEAERLGIEVLLKRSVERVEIRDEGGFRVHMDQGEVRECEGVLLATGGGQANKGFEIAEGLGHSVLEPVPSLFTFNIKDERIRNLQGISFLKAKVDIPETRLKSEGPLLITHWGMSGPAILRLSAWGARVLHEKDYNFEVRINFVPEYTRGTLLDVFREAKRDLGDRPVSKMVIVDVPKRFWEKLVNVVGISEKETWAHITNKQMERLAEELTEGRYAVKGKSTNKEEFVTCGGVSLKEINFKRMESKVCPGLFFAGEVLDIDGITGGFNFQAAWTTSWIAGNSM